MANLLSCVLFVSSLQRFVAIVLVSILQTVFYVHMYSLLTSVRFTAGPYNITTILYNYVNVFYIVAIIIIISLYIAVTESVANTIWIMVTSTCTVAGRIN